ncbi:MAG: hypothetical protein P0Y56_08525 [Candidatus Andeanibacterium colombiense]|uniref:Phosphatidate cytidylyltransferase n=1 Tax=Candidatus Andeanibacterium colombiense TaxID=3121345 RepID=A0AAJ6BPT5_9SPHN|nr:MAG: hypothetical protein P0Y56_08525 [Sphingomonadaceae bacterium]
MATRSPAQDPPLVELVRVELSQPVEPRAAAMAAAIASHYPDAARAVLFYGSCLRESALDGMMLDFYLIVSDYRAAYGKGWRAFANRVLPPNVFPFQHDGLIAKYAVLSEADFHRLCGPEAGDVSVWARFAQPSRIAWAAGDTARAEAVAAIARAAPTLLAYTAPLVPRAAGPDLWREGFRRTYGSELRAERDDRPAKIVAQDPQRYAAFAAAALAQGLPPVADPAAAWTRFRKRGKRLTILRLAKAITTFTGGVDYLAWKINRHSDATIVVQPWQRRWPLVGALVLLPRLLREGAVR